MFVQRDSEGRVVGIYANPQPGYAEERLADDHPDVVAFRNPPQTLLTYTGFRDRFTAQELAAMRAAVIQDGEALDWALEAAAGNSVNLAGDTVRAFMAKMVAAGIVTAERRDEILAP